VKPIKKNNKKNAQSTKGILIAITGIALLVKIILILRIQGINWYGQANGVIHVGLQNLLDANLQPANTWYGADAENYLKSVIGLFRDGLFSQEVNLHYWPSGYPILIWLVGIITQGYMLMFVSILQSTLYAYACFLFASELRRTRLMNFSIPIAVTLSLNPTLALNTISIGYELPTASFILISVALIIRYIRLGRTEIISSETFLASACMALASFMQPRLALLALVLFVVWYLAIFPLKKFTLALVFSIAIVSIAPAVMIFRNQQAMGFSAISTNLGVTMNLGAGDKANGGYGATEYGVPCPELTGNAAENDSARVKCVLEWYLANPVKTIQLFWNKSIYFWSPWFGPISNGTMARNPWRINHPLNDTIKTQSGAEMVFGTTGKAISYLWIIGSLGLLVLGARFLWNAGGLERLWSTTAISVILFNWFVTLGTIGDNRFRIPTMALSVLIQTIGLYSLVMSPRKKLVGAKTKISWPAILRSARPETGQ
jgi:hypothetical protein